MELREKKPQRCRAAERAEAGDMGDQTALAADSKLMVSLVVGKRPQEQTQTFVNDTKSRLRRGHVPAVCTETYAGEESALLERIFPPNLKCETPVKELNLLHKPF
jgi:hypothetical protein